MQSVRLTLAVVFGVPLILVSCKLGPVDYGRFEQRTIEENLAAIDSALVIYQAQFVAGNIDSACAQAQAFLLAQEGVDTAVISPDSLVWAFFSSGLLAGTGDVRRDTTGSGATGPEREPNVRVSSGGETGEYTHYVLPHNTELPGTQESAEYIRRAIVYWLGWGEGEMFKGSDVDLGRALGLINAGSGVTFWAGHGTLVPRDNAPGAFDAGLVLGKGYARRALAEAAVRQFSGYLNPGPGQNRQAAVLEFVGHSDFSVVVLPEFIRANGDFDNAESQPFNFTKTIVYLACCYSAYPGGAGPGPLVQAFLDVGADLVCGYTWGVGDAWACDKDEKFFSAMVDTCLPMEAYRSLGNVTDPKPGRGGFHAQLGMYGDTLVLLRAVCDVKTGSRWFRSLKTQPYLGGSSGLSGMMHETESSAVSYSLRLGFPGNSPGTFDCTAMDDAGLLWTDLNNGRAYRVMRDFVGVSGTIKVDRCQSDVMTGSFSGTLGWWDAGLIPQEDPPSATVTLEHGIFKYTGKIPQEGLASVSNGAPARD